ncbi:MAG TPA: hypothetical protein GXZ74_05920 [Tissierellia bacterium]|nr:hypothetical protein [Tissierellia bacterium]
MKADSIYDNIRQNIDDEGRLPFDFWAASPEDSFTSPGENDTLLSLSEEYGSDPVERLLKRHKRQPVSGPALSKQEIELIDTFGWASAQGVAPDQAAAREHLVEVLTKSGDADQVKLAILSLPIQLEAIDEEIEEILWTLGLAEDLTYYVLDAAFYLQLGNDQIYFDYAKRLHHYGRIMAFQSMDRMSEQQIDWMMRQGIPDTPDIYELSYDLLYLMEVNEMVQRDTLDPIYFDGILRLLEGVMASDNEKKQLDGYLHLDTFIRHLRRHARRQVPKLKHLETYSRLVDYFEDSPIADAEVLADRFRQMYRRVDWRPMIEQALASEEVEEMDLGLMVSELFDVDDSETVWRLMQQKPLIGAIYADRILKFPQKRDRVIDYYAELLSSDESFGNYSVYSLLLMELYRFPGMGMKLIEQALNETDDIAERAMEVILRWSRDEGESVEVLYPELSARLAERMKRASRELTKRYQWLQDKDRAKRN